MGFGNAAYVVGFAGSQPFWSYYGDKVHKPHLYAVGIYTLALSNSICIIMNFGYTVPMDLNYDTLEGSDQIALPSENSSHPYMLCETDVDPDVIEKDGMSNMTATVQMQAYDNVIPFVLYAVWSTIYGVGNAPQYSVALTHIDDHVEKTASPFLMSIPLACYSIGPTIGFMIAGKLLQTHYDFSMPSYDATDPRWIGNWWLLYPTMSLLASFFVTIMICQPQQKLPSQTSSIGKVYLSLKGKNNGVVEDGKEMSDVASVKKSGSNVRSAIKNIFSSKVYVCILVASTFR
jgi:MFS family permease